MTMETPQQQMMWTIPATTCENGTFRNVMGNEQWMQNFHSSCGASVATVSVPEEMPGNIESQGGYISPRLPKECAPELGMQPTTRLETPKFETPRRPGCWVVATPSPNHQYTYQSNQMVNE